MNKRAVLSVVLATLFMLVASCCSEFSFSSTQIEGASPTVADDDGIYEFGVEWVNNYKKARDLWLCDDDANHMDSKLRGEGWTRRFKKGNSKAKEDHWHEKENSYVDKADLVLFRGHGSKDWDWTYWKDLHGPMFREEDGWFPDYRLTPGEVRDDYGDRDAEWIAFGCCKALADGKGKYWAAAFDGAHLILGYKTNAAHTDYCTIWVDEMVSDGPRDRAKRVKEAWFSAADQKQTQGKVARVIGEDWRCALDYIWGQGLGPTNEPKDDKYYYYWDHKVNDLGPKLTSITESMTLYEIEPKTINEDYVAEIGGKFGISGDVEKYGDGVYYMLNGAKYLQVSEIEGIQYGDSSKLWVPVDRDIILPSLTEATDIATTFLETAGLLPSDALLLETVYNDNQTCVDEDTGDIINSTWTDVHVLFGREMDGFSIVGLGSRLKIYVGEGGEVIGFLNVWRNVTAVGTVNILGSEEALRLLTSYGSRVTLSGLPFADELNVRETTLGYFEEGFGSGQTYLTPVYMFLTDLIINQTVDSSSWIYVPAATEFVPPIVSITSPADGAIFQYGSVIDFTGSVIEYGYSPFAYSWSSDIDGYLGSSNSISSGLSTGNHTITLEVTDKNGTIGWDMITVNIQEPPVGGVGGIWVPVDKLALLAPYIGFISTIVVATVATAVYVKRGKRRKKKQ